jgi:16S rRNA (guanine527-N7)-methyltransferase
MSSEAQESAACRDATLTPAQQAQLACVLELLEADEHAPTTVRRRDRAAQVHVADSLVALEVDAVAAAVAIADLGSGVGFPGLALSVALPAAHVWLVESQRRRCEFMRRMCAAAGIANAKVVCARAEEWRAGLDANDLVVARALAPQPVVLEYAAPLLVMGGTVVDWRGRRSREQDDAGDRAAAQLGLQRTEVRRMTPFPGAHDRHLHVFVKASATPARFPRRAGVARKRPLAP